MVYLRSHKLMDRTQDGHRKERDEAGGPVEAVTTSSWVCRAAETLKLRGTCMSDTIPSHCRDLGVGVGHSKLKDLPGVS